MTLGTGALEPGEEIRRSALPVPRLLWSLGMLQRLSAPVAVVVLFCSCGAAPDEVARAASSTAALDDSVDARSPPCTPGRFVCETTSPSGAWCGDWFVPSSCRYLRIKAWGGGGAASSNPPWATGGGGAFVELKFENTLRRWQANGGQQFLVRLPGSSGAATQTYVRYVTPTTGGPLVVVAGSGGDAAAGYATVRGRGGGGGQAGETVSSPDAGTAEGGGPGTPVSHGEGGTCTGTACWPGDPGGDPGPHPMGGWLAAASGGYGGGDTWWGAKGGNGLFGGGGGGVKSGGGATAAGGGGGGGNYFAPFAPKPQGTIDDGDYDIPGNPDDSDRGDAGWGGLPGIPGQPGKVVLDYSGVPFEL
jgi:hypothetical protein